MKQPEALRLAEQLRDMSTKFKTPSHDKGVCNGASFELRRLHEANQAMLEALKVLADEADGFSVSGVYFNEKCMGHKGLDMASSAIAKGEQQ